MSVTVECLDTGEQELHHSLPILVIRPKQIQLWRGWNQKGY